MPEYKDQKTGEILKLTTDKKFTFPSTGAKILLKTRPPIFGKPLRHRRLGQTIGQHQTGSKCQAIQNSRHREGPFERLDFTRCWMAISCWSLGTLPCVFETPHSRNYRLLAIYGCWQALCWHGRSLSTGVYELTAPSIFASSAGRCVRGVLLFTFCSDNAIIGECLIFRRSPKRTSKHIEPRQGLIAPHGGWEHANTNGIGPPCGR